MGIDMLIVNSLQFQPFTLEQHPGSPLSVGFLYAGPAVFCRDNIILELLSRDNIILGLSSLNRAGINDIATITDPLCLPNIR